MDWHIPNLKRTRLAYAGKDGSLFVVCQGWTTHTNSKVFKMPTWLRRRREFRKWLLWKARNNEQNTMGTQAFAYTLQTQVSAEHIQTSSVKFCWFMSRHPFMPSCPCRRANGYYSTMSHQLSALNDKCLSRPRPLTSMKKRDPTFPEASICATPAPSRMHQIHTPTH